MLLFTSFTLTVFDIRVGDNLLKLNLVQDRTVIVVVLCVSIIVERCQYVRCLCLLLSLLFQINVSATKRARLSELKPTVKADELLEVRVILNFFVVALELNFAIFEADYRVC
jgi:hypothetical protein